MNTNPLAKLDKARGYLAECRSLPEVKKIRDLALAGKEYARAQRLGTESRNYAWEIQIEAERRAAEFLDSLEKKKGQGAGRPSKNHPRQVREISAYQGGLKEIGISDRDASRWRYIAEVPQTVVSSYVEQITSAGKEATTKGLLAYRHSLITPDDVVSLLKPVSVSVDNTVRLLAHVRRLQPLEPPVDKDTKTGEEEREAGKSREANGPHYLMTPVADDETSSAG